MRIAARTPIRNEHKYARFWRVRLKLANPSNPAPNIPNFSGDEMGLLVAVHEAAKQAKRSRLLNAAEKALLLPAETKTAFAVEPVQHAAEQAEEAIRLADRSRW